MGRCISLFECDPLLKLLNSYFLDPNQKDYLSNSQCNGGIGRYPHVCCKNSQAGRVTPTQSTPLRPVTQAPQSLQDIEYDINYLLPDPEKYDCGISIGQRIYGGQDADLDDFPWLALLEYSTRKCSFYKIGFMLTKFSGSRSCQFGSWSLKGLFQLNYEFY